MASKDANFFYLNRFEMIETSDNLMVRCQENMVSAI